MRKKLTALTAALDGRVEEHHRFLLEMQLQRLEEVEATLGRLDQRIDEKLMPYGEQHARLIQIPGIDRVGAAVLIAELGVDMSVFPSAQHCAAWAGVCPGNNESGGKRRFQPTRKGNVHLTTTLVQAAAGASHAKGTYLKDKYWRLKARIGPARAAMAVAHKILIAAYHMLSRGLNYKELGTAFLDQVSASATKRVLVKRLERLQGDLRSHRGFEVGERMIEVRASHHDVVLDIDDGPPGIEDCHEVHAIAFESHCATSKEWRLAGKVRSRRTWSLYAALRAFASAVTTSASTGMRAASTPVAAAWANSRAASFRSPAAPHNQGKDMDAVAP